MPLRLRDKNAVIKIDVDRTILHLRNMNQGDVEDFMLAIQQGKSLTNMRTQLAEIVRKIENVEGLNGQSENVVAILRDLDDDSFDKLLTAVLEYFRLTIIERKNLKSSSVSSAPPVEDEQSSAETIAELEDASVGIIENT